MTRFAPILLSLLLLCGQLGGVVHVYGHEALDQHGDCPVCLKYSSLQDAVTATASHVLPQVTAMATATMPVSFTGTALFAPYHSRAPPQAS